MFARVKKIGAYEYLYLVEGGRHVQRVIKALGRRDEVAASGLLDGLIASAARHSHRSIVLSSFYCGDLPELHRLSIGADLVFGRLWAETGCRDVLKSMFADRCFSFDVKRAVYLTVLHRLMWPLVRRPWVDRAREVARKRRQAGVRDLANRLQLMIQPGSGLQIYVAEKPAVILVVTAHRHPLPQQGITTRKIGNSFSQPASLGKTNCAFLFVPATCGFTHFSQVDCQEATADRTIVP
jgi:hypothetical protein